MQNWKDQNIKCRCYFFFVSMEQTQKKKEIHLLVASCMRKPSALQFSFIVWVFNRSKVQLYFICIPKYFEQWEYWILKLIRFDPILWHPYLLFLLFIYFDYIYCIPVNFDGIYGKRCHSEFALFSTLNYFYVRLESDWFLFLFFF